MEDIRECIAAAASAIGKSGKVTEVKPDKTPRGLREDVRTAVEAQRDVLGIKTGPKPNRFAMALREALTEDQG